MKPNFTLWIVLTLFLYGCNENKKQSENLTEDSVKSVQEEKDPNNKTFRQNGDYQMLFHSSRDTCPLITSSEIEIILQLSEGSVTQTTPTNLCAYEIVLADGTKYALTISPGKMNRKDIAAEIENFKKDDTGMLHHQISTTGDTHLCLAKPQSRLMLYNDNYDGYVVIGFLSQMVPKNELTSAEKRRENAITIGNALLEKYKN